MLRALRDCPKSKVTSTMFRFLFQLQLLFLVGWLYLTTYYYFSASAWDLYDIVLSIMWMWYKDYNGPWGSYCCHRKKSGELKIQLMFWKPNTFKKQFYLKECLISPENGGKSYRRKWRTWSEWSSTVYARDSPLHGGREQKQVVLFNHSYKSLHRKLQILLDDYLLLVIHLKNISFSWPDIWVCLYGWLAVCL